MRQKGILIKILSVLSALIIFGYLGVQVYELVGKNYRTATVQAQTVSESVNAEMYIIRDEVVLDSNGSGVILPIAVNGERVSRGSEIAAFFPSEQSASNYSMLKTLNEKLAVYKKISAGLKLANADIEKLSEEINTDFVGILNLAYNNDLSELSDYELAFAEKLSRKQISLGETVDCSAAIAELEAQIAALSSSSTPSSIVAAESSGYYVSRLDGYEGRLSASDIDTLTVQRLNDAFNGEETATSKQALGKIISGYSWYIACVLDNGAASTLKLNSEYALRLGNSSIKATAYAVKPATDGENLVIFKCNLMNEQLATLRRVSGSVTLNEYTGLKVSKQALRVNEDNITGVYVRLANIVEFRAVDTLYATDDYIIADEPSQERKSEMKKKGYDFLSLYDEVFVSGKELKDGMVIG